MRKDLKYIIIFVLALAGFVIIEGLMPKPIDWKPSFSSKDKIPYGNYVLYNQLGNIFPGKNIIPATTSIYENVDPYGVGSKKPIVLENKNYNYIIITHNFNPGETDIIALNNFVEKGNNVFIATDEYPDFFKEYFHLKIEDYHFSQYKNHNIENSDSLSLYFINPSLKGSYAYEKSRIPSYFSSFDTSKTQILGMNGGDQPTLIKINHGEGNFILSTTPLAFTNLYMLQRNNSEYVSKALSYLPEADIIWDEHFKLNRLAQASSPLRVILNYEPLRYAYYIIIAAIILFILFEAKRRQRIIPIIEPPQNATLEFVDTIGRLYYQRGNHKDIALKKITYFMDYIRNKYYLKTNKLDREFIEKLSEKSGRSEHQIKNLIATIDKINLRASISEQELMQLNRSLEEFYK